MIIKVIPLDISFDDDGLSYFAKDELKEYLKAGSVVSIPIRNNISFGIVSSFENEASFDEIKSIVEVICTFPIIDDYQISLIKVLADHYFLPIHKVMNLFLPKFILNRLEKNAFMDILDVPEISGNTITTGKASLFHNINALKMSDIINDTRLLAEDTVFILGDDFSIDFFLEGFPELKKDSLIFKNSMSYSKKYNLFLQVLGKKKNILIGTRKILQYNLARYKNLVYIEDSVMRYNYNQFERYKNIDILKNIMKIRKFDITFISTVPSIELMLLAKKEGFIYKTF